MKTIHVDVVSSERLIFSGAAKRVFVPAKMGEIGVLPNHSPLLSTLKPGEVRIEVDAATESIYVSGGIVEVQPHTVTVFSDTVMRAKDLDEAQAMAAKKAAEEAMAGAKTDQDLSATQAALSEAMAQLQMIAKMRGGKR